MERGDLRSGIRFVQVVAVRHSRATYALIQYYPQSAAHPERLFTVGNFGMGPRDQKFQPFIIFTKAILALAFISRSVISGPRCDAPKPNKPGRFNPILLELERQLGFQEPVERWAEWLICPHGIAWTRILAVPKLGEPTGNPESIRP
jgi:hypothetical protein